MTDQERLDELIDRWEEHRRQGREISVEELCPDDPALAAQLRRFIRALKATDWLSQPLDDPPAATASGETGTLLRAGTAAGQPDPEADVLGDYQLLEKIGGGGMGRVYRARHRTMQRLVALKILPGVDREPDAVRRFQREIRALARLSHPNIVTAYDAGQSAGTHFLVMELIDGSDLARHVSQHGPLPVAAALDYTLQVAQGLQYAHHEGVIHRDVKPSNLLLDSGGTVKILDLGLARFASPLCGEGSAAASQLTHSGSVFGTIDYMAPEQAADAAQADPRSDIYSLGCTLHLLLTGQPIFPGESVVERLIAHRERSVPSLRELRPDVPPQLDRVFGKMVAKQPADRYQTMSQLVTALAQCREAGAQAPAPVAAGRRRKLAVALAVLATVAGLAGLAGVLARLQTPDGSIVMEIDQPDATVVFEGPEKHATPVTSGELSMRLRTGHYTLTVSKPGFQPQTQQVDVTSDHQQSLRICLHPGAAPLVPARSAVLPQGQPAVAAAKAPPASAAPAAGGPAGAVAPFNAVQAAQYQQAWAKHLGQAVEVTNSLGMKMVLIPPGEFEMGATSEELAAVADDVAAYNQFYFQQLAEEGPRHHVRLSAPLRMAGCTVTVGQFRRFVEDTHYQTEAESEKKGLMGYSPVNHKWGLQPDLTWKDPGFPQTDEHPVVGVSYADAAQFCDWLSRKEHQDYGLPTEAQWEFACRAGSTTRYWTGNDPLSLSQAANIADAAALAEFPDWLQTLPSSDGFVFTAPVGRFKANAFGLFDMLGNVAQWCSDAYSPGYYKDSPAEDPAGSGLPGGKRVSRGAAWWDRPAAARCATRVGLTPHFQSTGLGLRVVQRLSP